MIQHYDEISAGMEWADETYPGWRDSVSEWVDRFDAAFISRCPLTFIAGSYDEVVYGFNGHPEMGETWATEHGFSTLPNSYDRLNAEWRMALTGDPMFRPNGV